MDPFGYFLAACFCVAWWADVYQRDMKLKEMDQKLNNIQRNIRGY